ncbi:sigma-70 family RNA polymerase sigma factor [Alicyclobacillus fodiniaquatilis]|uniref:Sigma-70 family RNA polymerase sigma factor n=1 Tax=Alicyclobacillus fodiniaquatilis TaxID=1661150 RepID=A0ABW4JI67_9BACL
MPYEAYQTWGRQQTNERIEAHLPLVYNLSSSLVSRAVPVGLEMGDLVHIGVLALYTASESFEAERGVAFGAYAKPFVRGAMLDEIARCKNESRSTRDKYRKVREAQDKLAQRMMREPTIDELANELGISCETLSAWMYDIGLRESASLDELAVTRELQPPDEGIASQPELHFLGLESKGRLVEVLARLPLQEQQLLYLYYQEELTLKEIGYVLERSESQISRWHKKVLAKLKQFLAEDESV